MLRFFTTSNPSIALIFALILLIAYRVLFAFHPLDLSVWQQDLAPLSSWIGKLIGPQLLGSQLFHLITSGIVVAAQAFYINFKINETKVFPKTGYLVGWIYLILLHSNPSFLVFSPLMIASTFIILVFSAVAQLTEKQQVAGAIFNAGLLVGLATLNWYPAMLLFFFVVVSIVALPLFRFRYPVLLIAGAAIPIIYLFSFYFLTDNFMEGIATIFSTFSFNRFQEFKLNQMNTMYLFVALFWSVLGLASTLGYMQGVIKDVRRILNMLILLSILITISYVFQNENDYFILLPILFPFSIFIAMFINRIKKPLFAELVHVSLLLPLVIQVVLIFTIK